MASKKVRQRISYVLENARSLGHRLGVNGLAVDSENNILYSGGRDGVVCAWDLHLDKPTQPPHADDDDVSKTKTNPDGKPADKPARPHIQTATSRAQTQAHTHWINDIALAQNNTALVTASSDLLVKIWRPRIGDNDDEPAVLGKHADYVKCVASPGQQSSWVASGGLDRRICLWDLQGGGNILEIDVSGEEQAEKGSVYALRANHNVLASGGPESTVRLWDPRTGKNITKFVGHTDNVRSILVNESGDTVMTASSDQTVKIWSVTAGRCMHTLTMHNDSVWSLYSDVPDLSVFYSSDRSGLIVKTDLRGCTDDIDNGLSVAVAQEHGGVSKLVASNGFIWTATSSSSINRWPDIDTTASAGDEEAISSPQPARPFSPSAETVRPHSSSVSTVTGTNGMALPRRATRSIPADIPAKSILRISNMAVFPLPSPGTAPGSPIGGGAALADAGAAPGYAPGPTHSRKGSLVPNGIDNTPIVIEPKHRLPVETIEGNCGLVKHRLLNDRRRVLTLDTAGDVILWDIIACKQIRQFGKRHLEDVEPEVNTTEAVAPWCSVDVSSGQLTVVLEQYNCFDAEMYADELEDAQGSEGHDVPKAGDATEFRDDMRINLGKWVLRYLFANLIDEELARDGAHRAKFNEPIEKRLQAAEAAAVATETVDSVSEHPHAAFAAAAGMVPPTPGIGLATPLPLVGSTPLDAGAAARTSQASHEDYFSTGILAVEPATPGIGLTGTAATAPAAAANTATAPAANDKDSKDKGKEKDSTLSPTTTTKSTPFGKKLRLGMSFGTKKLGRSASTSIPEKTAGAVAGEDGKGGANGANGTANGGTNEENKSESASTHDKEVDDCFVGVVQRMQHEYEKQLSESPDRLLVSRMSPFQSDEAPVLKIPPKTKVIIQEELTGGSIELYRGTVGGMGQTKDVDKIERCAPMWLAEALLSNTAQIKESTKISFLLLPYRDELPPLAVPYVPEPPAVSGAAAPPTGGPGATNRLNANRMLRVKKILAYVAEKLEVAPEETPKAAGDALADAKTAEAAETADASTTEETPEAAPAPAAAPAPVPAADDDLKPEEYLELYCNDQRLPNSMSLATVRAHIWKNSSDILLHYKSNGRKQLPSVAVPTPAKADVPQPGAGTGAPPSEASAVAEETSAASSVAAAALAAPQANTAAA
ncbi:wd repeat-containing protein [Ophiostoma piceae UAMH 11346]|uniref:Wd repeat-containing protein n=1 Tax=Ophiostoma piceae (strain UAMH 11346) TaxID=1262450 RepID=S3CBH5_OPHP1|nr:wd repeat-containing protein [Ophiostoma piceae UAMH 11346]